MTTEVVLLVEVMMAQYFSVVHRATAGVSDLDWRDADICNDVWSKSGHVSRHLTNTRWSPGALGWSQRVSVILIFASQGLPKSKMFRFCLFQSDLFLPTPQTRDPLCDLCIPRLEVWPHPSEAGHSLPSTAVWGTLTNCLLAAVAGTISITQ